MPYSAQKYSLSRKYPNFFREKILKEGFRAFGAVRY